MVECGDVELVEGGCEVVALVGDDGLGVLGGLDGDGDGLGGGGLVEFVGGVEPGEGDGWDGGDVSAGGADGSSEGDGGVVLGGLSGFVVVEDAEVLCEAWECGEAWESDGLWEAWASDGDGEDDGVSDVDAGLVGGDGQGAGFGEAGVGGRTGVGGGLDDGEVEWLGLCGAADCDGLTSEEGREERVVVEG